jgi:hypothetical protein
MMSTYGEIDVCESRAIAALSVLQRKIAPMHAFGIWVLVLQLAF